MKKKKEKLKTKNKEKQKNLYISFRFDLRKTSTLQGFIQLWYLFE